MGLDREFKHRVTGMNSEKGQSLECVTIKRDHEAAFDVTGRNCSLVCFSFQYTFYGDGLNKCSTNAGNITKAIY